MRKICFAFIFGAFSYGALEIIWRGYTHFAMLVLGGACLAFIYGFEEKFGTRMPFVLRNSLYTLFITFSELTAGLLLNTWLGLDIWDYSGLPMNLCGQICLPFSILWFLLSALCCLICRAMRFAFSS